MLDRKLGDLPDHRDTDGSAPFAARLATVAVLAALVGPAAAEAAPVVFGRSGHGRALTAVRVGDPRAPAKVLVVGAIHGNELAGRAVTRRLARTRPPRGTELWLVSDLNRNFSVGWRRMGRPFTTFYSGPRPFSERESWAARALILRLRPRVTIWYHQALALVTKQTGGDVRLEALYARRSGLPHRRLAPLPGTATTR